MPAPPPPVIEARSVVKRFGDIVAVDGIDLTVPPGICFGLLGPNGAGKTTTVRMIQSVSPLSQGAIRVLGLDVARQARQVKAQLGVCPQEDNLDPDFTVRRNLLVYARYFRIPAGEARRRADELLEFLQLTEKASAPIRELSGGMKRRLVLARALINNPRLLLLDEPTTGLDPQGRHAIWQRVRALKRAGTTILLTTHYMEEAAQLCDTLVIMDHGRVIASGSPERLVSEHVSRDVLEIWGWEDGLPAFLESQGWEAERLADRIFLYTDQGDAVYRELTSRFRMDQCLLRRGTLEDVFLKLTGRSLIE